jgi:hypothetical protein
VFTDAEIAMKWAYDRNLQATLNEAQWIINRKHRELEDLELVLDKTRADLAREREQRLAAESSIAKVRQILQTYKGRIVLLDKPRA